MWILISLLTIAASLGLVLGALRPFRGDRATQAVILLIWVRFALAALGEPATRPVIAGQSLLAMGTLLAIAVAVLIMPLAQLRSRGIAPFAAMAFVVLLSGLLNGRLGALVNSAILWTMFAVVALLIRRALECHGAKPVLRAVLAAFSLPIGLQLLSIVFGQSIISQDETITYVGNYVHEAVFSTVALCGLWLVTIYPWEKRSHLVVAFALATVSLVMANYRTMIIAALPIGFALIARFRPRIGPARSSPVPLLIGVALFMAVLPMLATERFAELGTVFREMGNLAKPPEEFTASEKDILSARAYIWAAYVKHYLDAGLLQHLIGFGPGANTDFIGTHPHNEYLRILFESGIAGLLIWIGTIAHLMGMSLRRAPRPANIVLAAGYAALLVGSLGTSFFIRPEGIILVALLVALTWHLTAPRALVPPGADGVGVPAR